VPRAAGEKFPRVAVFPLACLGIPEYHVARWSSQRDAGSGTRRLRKRVRTKPASPHAAVGARRSCSVFVTGCFSEEEHDGQEGEESEGAGEESRDQG